MEERNTPGRTIVYCRTLHLSVYMKYGLVGRKRQQQSGIGNRALSLRSNALSAVCDEDVEAANWIRSMRKAESVKASYMTTTRE